MERKWGLPCRAGAREDKLESRLAPMASDFDATEVRDSHHGAKGVFPRLGGVMRGASGKSSSQSPASPPV